MHESYEIQGQTVKLPVVVRDAASGNAMYLVDAAAVARLLPGDAFEVLEAAPGKTQLILGMIDYRDNDLGDYNEVAVIFFVKPRGADAEEAGTFIYKLPVNQGFTCEAGALIWGFPKTVEEIDIDYSDTSATCKLVMGGQHVFTLTVPRAQPKLAEEDPGSPGVTYTYIQGAAHRTPMTNGGRGTVASGDVSGVSLELGDHPLADEIRGLGLSAAPILCTWTEHMMGNFLAPEKL